MERNTNSAVTTPTAVNVGNDVEGVKNGVMTCQKNLFQYCFRGGVTGAIVLPVWESMHLSWHDYGDIVDLLVLKTKYRAYLFNFANVMHCELAHLPENAEFDDELDPRNVMLVYMTYNPDPISIEINSEYTELAEDMSFYEFSKDFTELQFLFFLIFQEGRRHFPVHSRSGKTNWFNLDDVAVISVPMAGPRAEATKTPS